LPENKTLTNLLKPSSRTQVKPVVFKTPPVDVDMRPKMEIGKDSEQSGKMACRTEYVHLTKMEKY
jgi:hypothetical protein